MAQIQRKPISEVSTDDKRHGKHRLDEMDARLARHLTLLEPTDVAVSALMAEARLSIPGLAATEDVLKTVRYNPEYFLVIGRNSKVVGRPPVGEGFIAWLPLSMLGLQHLALGTFNAAAPDVRLLAKPHERPAGVYLWAVFAPGTLVAAMALFMEKMRTDQYEGVNIYSRPNTDVGCRFNIAMGFTTGTSIGEINAPNVWVFPRPQKRPLYDTYVPGAGKTEIGITVARNFEDLMRVAAIRNAVYIGEQHCPYNEEYDGNDLSATHLIAYIGDEPVGCLRLRFFADFAKFERMAIRKEFRKSRAAIQLARAGFQLCQKKGYRRVCGHIQEQLITFWSRFGFRPKPGGKKFIFSDFEYTEIVADIERDPAAITIDTDPYVLIRPEGRWDTPGVLEHSATRPITEDFPGKTLRHSERRAVAGRQH